MARKNYVNVSIPSELAKELDKSWKKSKKYYRSKDEFVLEALREKLDKGSKDKY